MLLQVVRKFSQSTEYTKFFANNVRRHAVNWMNTIKNLEVFGFF